MCLALAAYENRIASLLETANRLVVVELPPTGCKLKEIIAVIENTLPYLIKLLHKNNITVLICGAINGCMFNAIEHSGIHVIPWITGDVEDVLEAFKTNKLERCVMPGCSKSYRRGRRGRRGWIKQQGKYK